MSAPRAIVLAGVGLAVAIAPSGVALAKVSEKALAQCAIASDFSTASNFATAELPRRIADFHRLDRGSALGLRLIAACSPEAPLDRLPDLGKLKREIGNSLKSAAVSDGPSRVNVLLCRQDADVGAGVMRPFRYEVVRAGADGQVVIASQDYTYLEGHGSAPLPRDLHVQVPAGTKTERSCQSITEDGSLADA